MFKSSEAASIGIIGGADGPTAIFLSGETALMPLVLGGLAAAAVAGLVLFFVLRGRR